MKRTRLSERQLPSYTHGEEIMNMVTHIVGGSIGLIALIACTLKGIKSGQIVNTVSAIIYGISIVMLYTISSIYHGLRPGTGKKVLQIIDHCTIYFLIAGTYTPILVASFIPKYPFIGWGLLLLQWGLGVLAATLNAIDLKKYKLFSMICYIVLGWSIIFFIPQAMYVLSNVCLSLIFWGGIAYTIGAILFGIGAKIRWFHSIFHIFVLFGTILQLLGIYLFVL